HGRADRAVLVDDLISARLLSSRLEKRPTGPPEDPALDGVTADPNDRVERIDIIHESLLKRWDRLRRAVDAGRELLKPRERFRVAVQSWIEHDRADAYLLSGGQLSEVQVLAERGDTSLQNPAAQELLACSVERAQRQEQVERDRQRRELEAAQALLASEQ